MTGSIFFPLVSGAVAYAMVQFLWYAPFAFGTYHLRQQGMTVEGAAEEVMTHPERRTRLWFGVLIPAFLTSFALMALREVTDQMLGTQKGFLTLVFLLGLAVCLPKYLVALFRQSKPQTLVLIQDGALLVSLLATAFAIILSTTH